MNITILTLGSRGDVQPYVSLGAGLLAAGHRVTLATHACFESFTREYGLRFSPVAGDPRGLLEGEAGQMWLASDRNPLRFMRRMMVAAEPLFRQAAGDYWAAAQDADLLLYPLLAALPATSIAEKLGIPAFSAYLQHVHPTSAYPVPMFPPAPRLGGTYNRLTYALGEELYWRSMRPVINGWRRASLDLPPLTWGNPFGKWTAQRLPCLYGFSEAVLPRPPEWTDNVHITGYWFLPPDTTWQPDPGLVDFLASGPPPVFVGFGSMAGQDAGRATGIVLDALTRARCRGLLLTGWGGLQAAPASKDIYTIHAAPFDWLFPRVAAVVHHGGAGTTAAGLAAGRPSVLVPFVADQHFWGWRVATLGAGPTPVPRKQLTVERLAAAIVQATTDPAMRAGAAAIGRQIQAEDGVGEAVALIGSLLAQRPDRAPIPAMKGNAA